MRSPERPELHAWTSDHFPVPLPAAHPFPSGKHPVLRERLVREDIVDEAHVHRSEPAPIEWLESAHDPAHVRRMLEGAIDPAEQRRLGLPWSPALATRARAALYGTVEAARAALVHGIAGNLAGGSHHAFRDRAEAYCLFNDIAAAILLLRRDGHARRPFVVDLDVHQGNGTAAIFANDPDVFTFSIHADANYPTQKERSSLDVALPRSAGDDVFLETLDRHLPRALEAHAPDFIVYQAGVDGLDADRFGTLALSHAGLAERDARVFRLCEQTGAPVVITLGGGYGRPLETSIEAHVGVWRAAREALDRRATAGRA